MHRTLFAITSAIALTFAYAMPAEACISCSYTPEVLNSGASGGASARPSKRARAYTESRERRSSKKHVAREHTPRKNNNEKAASATSEAAKTAAAETEHSTITTTGSAISNQVKAAIRLAPTGPQNENSTISTASTPSVKPADAKHVEQVTADQNVGCKKYFPSTGLTLSVPCE
ncbi:conserved exported protein of unknown function [Hyphomicrobium sp. 1Nfss2.1]|uniref:hypothetical protein n=1 Tax=Hyphomicrobium sp. 1Nfss2.1 TaxID=3413936 RepID=UPI003C7C8CA3